MVGAGQTYTQAARTTRDRAHRFRVDRVTGELMESAHPQLLMDWVEVFAPVVFEPEAPVAWPAKGTLVIDSMDFRVKDWDKNGKPVLAGKAAFNVLAAMGYEGPKQRPVIWRMETFRRAGAAEWMQFLSSLPGTPERVVSDAHTGILKAVNALWPQTDLYLCDWHLRLALERLLKRAAKMYPAEVDRLMPWVKAGGPGQPLGTAFSGWSFWDNFVTEARKQGIQSLDKWLDKNDPIIRWQFARRHPHYRRPQNMPITTGGLETKMKPIDRSFHPRRYALRNRERINRLLMLMQNHAKGRDREIVYTRRIREWLEANGGRPQLPRRAVTDPNCAFEFH